MSLVHSPSTVGPSRCSRSASGGDECALQKAAPFGIEIVEQFLAVELEIRAIAIIACTHSMVLPV